MSLFNRVSKFGSSLFRKITTPISATLKYVSKSIQKQKNITNSLEGEDRITALISKEVYSPPSNRAEFIESYKLDRRFNELKHCVYVDENNKSVIVAFRGTQLDLEDLANDANIIRTDIFDEENIRFNKSYKIKEAEDLYNRVRELYKGYKIINTGHSLAGRQVLELARNNKAKKINGETYYNAFNAGGMPSQINEYPKENTKIFLTGSDILSFGWSRHPSAVIVERKDKKLANNHSINYFI